MPISINIENNGLCQGFCNALAQSLMSGQVERFNFALKNIKEYSPNYNILVEKIENAKFKRKHNTPLNNEEIYLLDIPAIFDTIMLQLNPGDYQQIFEKNLSQDNLKEIFNVIKPENLEDNDLKILLNKTLIFNKDKLAEYFIEMQQALNEREPVLLRSDTHTVLLSKNEKENCWNFSDINYLSSYTNPLYCTKLNTEELLNQIFISFKDEDVTLFDTVVLSVENDDNVLKKFNNLDSKFAITENDLKLKNKRNTSLFWMLCRKGDINTIKYLIENFSFDINEAQETGETPLYIACQNNHIELVKFLLSLPIKKNLTHISGASALYIAAQNGNEEIVTALIESGIDPNLAHNSGATALYIASQNKNYGTIEKLFLSKDLDVNASLKNGITALYIASKKGYTDIVKLLLSHKKIKVDKTTNSGISPLFSSLLNNHLDISNLLIKAGANLDDTCKTSKKSIYDLIKNKDNSLERFQRFLKKSNQNNEESISLSSRDLIQIIDKNILNPLTKNNNNSEAHNGSFFKQQKENAMNLNENNLNNGIFQKKR